MNSSRNAPPFLPLHMLTDSLREDDQSSDYEEIHDEEEEESVFEIDRSRVTQGDVLGAGQFGDVFRGTYYYQGEEIEVAIKSCKLEKEEEMASKLIEEAGIMEQFDHKHIIRFYGVCSSHPVWIVMELAEMGEMRKFLKDNKDSLPVDRLVSYCHQLSTAMQYLERRNFVHRDIAARNVLVSSWSCVKLADFGLSRWLSDNNYYKASKAVKLPIKWMAPESINFRRFTTMSDVWMFAVCMWEIMTYGDKPFPGVNNNEVIRLLEDDVRLPLPAGCPPSLYLAMCACWNLDPKSRPRFSDIVARIRSVHLDEQQMHDQDMRHSFKRKQQHHRGSSVDADAPPEKPYRSLSRRHSGFVGRSNPELDETTRGRHLDLEQFRVSPWKSDHNVTGPEDSDDRLRIGDHYRCPPRATPVRDTTTGSHHVLDYHKLSPATLEERMRQQQQQSQMDSSWLKVVEEKHAQRQPCGTSTSVRKPAEETETKKKEEEEHAWEERLRDIVLSRKDDVVHKATLEVVSAVTQMIKTLDNNTSSSCSQLAHLYLPMVKNIGDKLKTFVTGVDQFLTTLPTDAKQQVIMATKVLNSDMAELIHQMKLAQQYSSTVLDKEYLKKMLQAGHALAVDCKNLLEAVDITRKKQIYLQRRETLSPEAVTSQ